jgi:hypothetical protein
MLTLKQLIESDTYSTTKNSNSKRRIRLMRHAFRGGRDDLKKCAEWTGVRLTPGQADPTNRNGAGLPTARAVLNAVRFEPKLVELISAEQGPKGHGLLKPGDLLLVFGATGGRSAEYLGAFDVGSSDPSIDGNSDGTLSWKRFQERYSRWLVDPPQSARDAGLEGKLVRGLGYNAVTRENDCFYDLHPNPHILTGLERRLIVEWKSGVVWFQKELEKEVLEIRPKGFVQDFPGLLEFTLSFDEMRQIVGVGKDAHASDYIPGDPAWRSALGAAAGVYLIQSDEGNVYVGAAFGKSKGGGFLGRWRAYAETNPVSDGPNDTRGLRGNVGLKAFLDAGSADQQRRRLRGLHFSIAHVMPRSASKDAVEAVEAQFKNKLKSRSTPWGLNKN